MTLPLPFPQTKRDEDERRALLLTLASFDVSVPAGASLEWLRGRLDELAENRMTPDCNWSN
jgi:hypothetical protein